MVRPLALVALLSVALAPACSMPHQAPPQAPAQAWVTHLSVLAGARSFDDGDLKDLDLDDQLGIGVELDSYDADSGSGWEVGYAQSDESSSLPGGHVEVDLRELYVGFRQTFMPERSMHPYVGVGASYMRAHANSNLTPSDDDSDLGPYAHAGVLWDIGERLRLGVDFRMAWANFNGTDGDYQQLAASLGWRF